MGSTAKMTSSLKRILAVAQQKYSWLKKEEVVPSFLIFWPLGNKDQDLRSPSEGNFEPQPRGVFCARALSVASGRRQLRTRDCVARASDHGGFGEHVT